MNIMDTNRDLTIWTVVKGDELEERVYDVENHYPLADMVDNVRIGKAGHKTTIAFMTLKNGFEIVGTSACVDPKIYDLEIGAKWALKSAFDELEKYEGYQRQIRRRNDGGQKTG